jgi:hypothetical protein
MLWCIHLFVGIEAVSNAAFSLVLDCGVDLIRIPAKTIALVMMRTQR